MKREVCFDRFRFDSGTGRLWAGDQERHLTPKASAVMTVLLARSGEPVTKQDLFATVWPDTAVTDDALTTCIVELRRALEDDAKHPRFIETRHRRGYRFLAPLSPAGEDPVPGPDAAGGAETPTAAPTEPAVGRSPGGGHTIRPTVGAAVAGIVVLVVVLAALWWSLGFGPGSAARPEVRSLAVLPLANLTGDASQDYFSDGMTDALITDLASLSDVRVISRQSVMRYKGSATPLPDIARELGVEAVVEGSVVRSAGRVRITAQLVAAETERHLWARSYERRLEDVLALQSEVASAIAREIGATVGAESRRRSTERAVNPDAFDAYLLGRHLWNQRTEQSLDRAIEYFQSSVAKDKDFALAYAGLALAFAPRVALGYVPPGQGLAEVKAAALKALELDPDLGDARAALAAVRTQEWDWDGAETEYRHALKTDPNSVVGHLWYGWHLHALGRVEESLAHRRRALELDPLNLTVNQSLAGDLDMAGRREQATAQWQRVHDLEPESAMFHLTMAVRSLDGGDVADSASHVARATAVVSNDARMVAFLAIVHAMSRNTIEARRLLARLEAEARQRYVSPVLTALVHVALDQMDEAFVLLDQACDAKDPLLIGISVGELSYGPRLTAERVARLRADRRFGVLLQRMGVGARSSHPLQDGRGGVFE